MVYIQAEAQQADSVDVINAWASRVTKGLIQMAMPPGTPFDMVLTNAVYFKVTDAGKVMPPSMQPA
jgi:serine protease inhibitor